ncbi:MAG TPA: DUF5063 domain-containing protein [Beutenbergiaceae bacterium]|nr:DUF5063 domain-containing protein [Beutenbergiaceae bacterium]
MSEPQPGALDEDLLVLADTVSRAGTAFLDMLAEVAAGSNPEASISLLLLATSDLAAIGARLGAIVDVVPRHRFEPDEGPEADLEPIRTSLANLFAGMDEYTDVADPLVSSETVTASLANDLADVGIAVATGLSHYHAGHASEALWWWQFSYLSHWGERALAASRALLTVISHLRLDVDDDTALAAQIDALAAADPTSER